MAENDFFAKLTELLKTYGRWGICAYLLYEFINKGIGKICTTAVILYVLHQIVMLLELYLNLKK